MKAYIYLAALLCETCGEATRLELTEQGKAPANPSDESSYDSDEFPKGPYTNGGGEADCPQHCDQCSEFLENPLTDDGDSYVRQAAEPFAGPDDTWSTVAENADREGSPVVAGWVRFYFADGM